MAEFNGGDRISEELEELIAGYALNALSVEDAEQFERYLLDRPELLEEVHSYQQTASLLAYAPPRVSPPDRLRSQIMDSIAPSSPKTAPSFSWRKAAIALVAIFSLGVLVDNYLLRRELVTAQSKLNSLKAEENYVFILKGTAVAPTASGKILIDEPSQKIATVIQNLPPLPAGKSYFLWAVSGTEKVRCGKIERTGNRIVEAIAIPPVRYDGLDIKLILTLESAREPVSPSQDIIMTGVSI